jgi:hypothetical protein
MDDAEFLRRFEDCTLEDFRHRDHVRLAWLCLREHGWDGAVERVRSGIRRFAAHHGAARKYHETMTVAWLALVAAAMESEAGAAGFDDLLEAHPRLLDSGALSEHYSPTLLASERAREAWNEPDLRPIGRREVAR